MKCPACNSASIKLLETLDIKDVALKVADYAESKLTYKFILDCISASMLAQDTKNFSIYKCNNCGLEYVSPLVLIESLYTQLYPSTAYWDRWEFGKVIEIIQNQNIKSVFEVGCGSGIFLSKLIKLNIRYAGIDLSRNAIDLGRQNGLNVYLAGINEMGNYINKGIGNSKVDTIVLFQVFEHLTNPYEFLTHASQFLSDGGYLFISVPSLKRPSKILNVIESFDYPPHHLTRWTEKAFKEIAERSGYQISQIIYEPIAQQFLKKQIARSKVYSSGIYQFFQDNLSIPIIARQDTEKFKIIIIKIRQGFVWLNYQFTKTQKYPEDSFSGETMLVILQKNKDYI